MKKRALGLSGKAAMEEGVEALGGGTDERKSRVVRHKRNSFGDTGTSPAPALPPPRLLLLLLLFYSSVLLPPVPSGPETPCFFTGLWDFFHADRRVVHQRGLTVSRLSFFLPPTRSDSHALWRERNGRKRKREREKEIERAKRKREEQ